MEPTIQFIQPTKKLTVQRVMGVWKQLWVVMYTQISVVHNVSGEDNPFFQIYQSDLAKLEANESSVL